MRTVHVVGLWGVLRLRGGVVGGKVTRKHDGLLHKLSLTVGVEREGRSLLRHPLIPVVSAAVKASGWVVSLIIAASRLQKSKCAGKRSLSYTLYTPTITLHTQGGNCVLLLLWVHCRVAHCRVVSSTVTVVTVATTTTTTTDAHRKRRSVGVEVALLSVGPIHNVRRTEGPPTSLTARASKVAHWRIRLLRVVDHSSLLLLLLLLRHLLVEIPKN
jgi:hypothetical protein